MSAVIEIQSSSGAAIEVGITATGPAGQGVPAGGTAGQVLAKSTNDDYDAEWGDAGAGTVTSVAVAVPTGLSVAGSPITGAGTITITFAAGYAIPTTAKQAEWDSAYGWGNHAVAGYALNSNIGVTIQGYSLVLANTTASFTAAQETKLGYISVTQAVDLDAIETRVNALDAAVVLKGVWDASAGTFPGSGAAQAGDSWIASGAGTVGGIAFAENDRIIAIADNASTSTYASNWHKADYTDQVVSVCGRTGAVTVAAADITDSTTAGRTLLTAADEAAQRAALALTPAAFTADADTQITPTTPIVLNNATGNEIALALDYTVNKAISGNDTGLKINQTDTASPGTSRLLDLQAGGVSLINVRNNGALYSGVSDGASAVAFTLDTENSLANAGAKILSLKNNGTEKAYFNKDGTLVLNTITITGRTAAGQNSVLIGGVYTVRIGHIDYGGEQLSLGGGTIITQRGYDALIATGHFGDQPARPMTLCAASQSSGSSTNLTGGNLSLCGGNGASGSAGDAHGGNVYLTPGTGYGTGHHGYIIMANVPTSSAGLPTGAIWNNSGVLNIV